MPTFGEFETLGEPLAVTEERGDVSTVWQARRTGGHDKQPYAVKCYTPRPSQESPAGGQAPLDRHRGLEFLEGVKQIRQALSAGGRGLAPIHDLGISELGAWFVTDFYPRNNLKAWIMRRGGVDSAALRHVVQSVVAGCLALKRSRGYSHGNLKPSNIFLGGQPRPLRKTPLQLTDAFPAAPLQLAALDSTDQTEVGELLHKVMEAQDLRTIGELILQLVEGRLFSRSDDYNYPVARSPVWEILGKDTDYWLGLCNKLVNPQLSLDQVNLESLEREFRPSQTGLKAAMAAGVIAGICLIAGGGYLAVSAYRGHRSKVEGQRNKARENWASEIALATECMNGTNFAKALDQFGAARKSAKVAKDRDKEEEAARGMALADLLVKGQEALQRTNSSEALKSLEAAVEGSRKFGGSARWLSAQAYPIADGYLKASQPEQAERWVKLALVAPPNTSTSELSVRLSQAQKAASAFQGLLTSARNAESGGNFTNALALYQQADRLRAGDSLVIAKLRELAPKAAEQADRQRRRMEEFGSTVTLARNAERDGNYTNALALYQSAAKVDPQDPQVQAKVRELAPKAAEQTRLALQHMNEEERKAENFRTTVANARAAEAQGNFTNALALYQQADKLKSGDLQVAAKIKELGPKAADQADRQRRRMEDFGRTVVSAQNAERAGNFTNALALYQEAAKLNAEDPEVQRKLKELGPKAADQARLALEQMNEDQRKAENFRNAVANARAAESQGNFTNALALYQQADKLKSGDLQVAAKIRELGPKAAEQADRQRRRMEDFGRTVVSAQNAERAGNFTNALALYQEAARLNADDAQVQTKLKELAPKAAEQVRLAEAHMKEQQRIVEKFSSLLTNAQLAEAQGNFTNALTFYQEADVLKPGDAQVTAKLTELRQKAANQTEQEHRKMEDFGKTMALAQAAERDGNYTNALALYKRAATLNAADPQVQAKVMDLTSKAAEQTRLAKEQMEKFRAAFAAAQESERAGNFTNALVQYREAQRWNSGDAQVQNKITELLPKATQQEKAAAMAARNEQDYQAATNAANSALAQGNFQEAARQAGIALVLKPGDAVATGLLNKGQKGIADQAMAAQKETDYRAATNAATTALSQGNFQEATNQAAIALGLKPGDAVAMSLKRSAEEGLDLRAARGFFDTGDYPRAVSLCSKHEGAPSFTALVRDIGTERSAFDEASRSLAKGEYGFVRAVATNTYATKAPFSRLVQDGTKEAKVLSELDSLKSTSNWVAAMKILNDSNSQGFTNKPPFVRHWQWAQGLSQQAELSRRQELRTLDKPLANYLKQFGVKLPSTTALTETATVAALPNVFIEDTDLDRMLKQVKSLQGQFEAKRLLDQPRKDAFAALETKIKNWNRGR